MTVQSARLVYPKSKLLPHPSSSLKKAPQKLYLQDVCLKDSPRSDHCLQSHAIDFYTNKLPNLPRHRLRNLLPCHNRHQSPLTIHLPQNNIRPKCHSIRILVLRLCLQFRRLCHNNNILQRPFCVLSRTWELESRC